ncbi:hypothetical protein [Enterococcus dongliensis]|uniref:hypothetical protein n=1 Tax=Enterococcus dongliensis TaxID=2559925 RepID=UPI002892CBE7|nr:hypothetical protein [Enterococcus dongliensis]
MKNFIRTLFTSLTPAYLFRQYLYAGIVFACFVFVAQGTFAFPMSLTLFMGLNFILYPFAMFVYDSFIGLIIGNHVFLVNLLFSLLWSVFKIFLIYLLSLFLAPIGIAMLYFTHR